MGFWDAEPGAEAPLMHRRRLGSAPDQTVNVSEYNQAFPTGFRADLSLLTAFGYVFYILRMACTARIIFSNSADGLACRAQAKTTYGEVRRISYRTMHDAG